jgi:NAD-specific glutamate dehydrogenase
VPAIAAARAYAQLGDATGINWVYARLGQVERASLWDRMVLVDLRREMLDLQRRITEGLLRRKPDDLGDAVADYLADHAQQIRRVRDLQRHASVAGPSALSVIAAELRVLQPEESDTGR